MFNKTCIVISGPTAAGKTKLSLQLAEYFKTDIISADSRQCYRELNIGVAKPTASDLLKIKHYFISTHSIQEEMNAGRFETYALQSVAEIFEQHNIAIMVGGTGLYIKAFCKGMDDMPEVKEEVRQRVRQQYETIGISWLQEMLRQHDPVFYSKGEMQNPQRMMRALEVKLSSGKSILALHSLPQKQREFSVINIGMELPRKAIYHNINERVDSMMNEGLLEEATALYPYRHLNALQTVGYTELFDYIDGKCTIQEAVDTIKKNTRHYAKRQLTWFKRDESIHWFAPDDVKNIIDFIEERTHTKQHHAC
ncbi:tRNA (adenosine(37)-N6)-dimethylallyltransferase MiaA [Agriterribacter sp.]|uniref:tRNA (adenosine(37)-N6)-dimethylallyltransferase MiaA n=1 Tax=Agriterribacter sp. TaxID=2821509 RepID=UPI002CFEA744|nr:tRNA (adenosine(37)-N6)-dimethylallyltransferase MiaA [Agriterribacter sp.]HTN05430.1 tRNA (adenosine(37)-N6)-dimethylallyltransferase MiaA [Agriterribacter sp.]